MPAAFHADHGDDGPDGTASAPPPPGRRQRLFGACACILGNECAERLTYYGLATNLPLYAKEYLGYGAAAATSKLQAWKATVYVTPLLGAFLADAYLGRFLVILVFSLVYLLGLGGITGVNLDPKVKPRFMSAPASGSFEPTRSMFWGFLYLIALGSGGIKACVSAFGGDQFRDDSAVERGWRSSFFNWFYFSINVGSLIATLVVVPVQESKGYGVGFLIPSVCMAAAVSTLAIGAAMRLYHYVPPEGSPLFRVFQVLRWAFLNRNMPAPADAAMDCYEPDLGAGGQKFRMPPTRRMRALERAALPHGRPGCHQVTLSEVEEAKALLGLGPLFLCTCVWQACYDPIFSLLPFPGDVMERSLGSSGLKIPASSISFANTFGVLVSVALYDLAAVPAARRLGRPISEMGRIGAGYVVLFAALMSAGFIEVARYQVVRSAGLVAKWDAAVAADPGASYVDPAFTEPMSIWWQTIPYALVGAAETLTLIGVLELFYTQVSEGTRALSSAIQLLTTAVGTYMASALNTIVALATQADPWVADNPLKGHYDWYFFLNAGILLLGYAAFLWVARGHEGSFAQGGHHPGHGLRVPREVELGAGPGSLSGSPASARSTQLLLAGGHLRARLAGYRTPGPDAAAAASPRAGGGGMPGLLPALEPL